MIERIFFLKKFGIKIMERIKIKKKLVQKMMERIDFLKKGGIENDGENI